MQSQTSSQNNRSTFTLTTTCLGENGVAVPVTAMLGLETPTSTSITGSVGYSIWPTMYAPLFSFLPMDVPRKTDCVVQGKKWPNLISIGLRNELRKPDKTGSSLPYNWQTWYEQIKPAADIVNAANPNILIFLSGLDYDTKLTPIPTGDDLGGGKKFRLSDFSYKDKLVLELHNYQNSAKKCSDIEGGLWDNGFRATYPDVANRMPVVLTEFGFTQADKSYNGVYATCLHSLMVKWKTGWMVWALGGSYYIRGGTQDYEETWGLLNHQWSDWRNKDAISALKGMVDDTLKSVRR